MLRAKFDGNSLTTFDKLLLTFFVDTVYILSCYLRYYIILFRRQLQPM